MVSNNKYLNARSQLFELTEQINNMNQCNARLMAIEMEQTAKIDRLTAEVEKLTKTIEESKKHAYALDAERLKMVNGKRKAEQRYAELCRLVSELEIEGNRSSLCDKCRYQDDDGFTCNCPRGCLFEMKEK